MFAATVLMEQLTPADVDLMLSGLKERTYLADELVIAEGALPSGLYIVLNGLVRVYAQTAGGQQRELAHLGAGEILGDIAWLEGKPASASVRAQESSLLGVLGIDYLEGLLASEKGFAARLLRGLATVNAGRVRRLTNQLRAREAPSGSATGTPLLQRVEDVKALLLKADREAIAAKGSFTDETVKEVHGRFAHLVEELNAFMNKPSEEIPETVKQEYGALVQRELLPYVLMTGSAERAFSKPRGYAGDCETIDMMYAHEPKGSGRLGPLLDACFQGTPAAAAVRNRRKLMAREILACVGRARPARVMSLACGPAAEVFDTFKQLENPADLRVTAIDIDAKALDMVNGRALEAGCAPYVTTHQANLVYLASGRQALDIAPQKFIYSIGLIDYFQDKFVIQLIDWIYDRLAPGGRVLLGNFHPRNVVRALMDHVLEWRLIHRDEDDMNRLFRASRFAKPCTRILYEEQRINLFAECIKD